MHPHDRGAVDEAPDRHGQRRLFARVDGRVVEHRAEKRLARRADQQRHFDARRELRERGEQREVVIGRLGKTDARIGEQRVGAHAGVDCRVDPRAQLVADLAHDIVVVSFGAHRARRSAGVHHDQHGVGVGDDAQHVGIGGTAGHVVHDHRARLERRGRDGGLRGVDAHRDRGAGNQRAHDRKGAPELFIEVDGIGAGPGRLAPDIENGRPGSGQRQAVIHGRSGIGEAAAVGEGVGRDVDHAHERPPGKVGEGEAGHLRRLANAPAPKTGNWT